MITVTYNPERLSLRVKGHAHSDEYGKDLVCAAASILCETLAANLRAFEKNGWVTAMTADISAGEAKLAATPCKQYKAVCRLTFTNIVAGFRTLAERNPEYCELKIVGGLG